MKVIIKFPFVVISIILSQKVELSIFINKYMILNKITIFKYLIS